jgi:hypothetical protein
MYLSQQRSTDLCIDFYIHSTQDSFCGGNCLRSKLWIFVRGGAIKAYLVYPSDILIRTSYRLAAHLYTLPIRTYFIMHCLSGRCHIWYRIFPTKTPAFIVQ